MTSSTAPRPVSTEYAPYYDRYVSRVGEGNIIKIFEQQKADTLKFFGAISEERGGYRYAEGKWSIKEVLGHVIDAERIFSYRALRFGRGDNTELAGFEQDDYMIRGQFDRRTLSDLLSEYAHVRDATIALFSSFDDAAFSRSGIASSNPVSVRALAYIIAGHELHHMEVIRGRYL